MLTDKSPSFYIGIVFIVTVSIWFVVVSFRGRSFELWFFEVGQGDSIFIQTSGRKQILIDGGPDTSVLRELSKAMPFWDRSIDLVVATHPHADHVGGIVEVLRRYQVGELIMNPTDYTSPVLDELARVIEERGVAVRGFGLGDRIEIGELYLRAIWPPLNQDRRVAVWSDDVNQHAIALDLEYNDFTALLMSDVELGESVPDNLQQELRDVDVLKVPHQGSKYGLRKEALEVIKPEVAVITVGKNKFGHPADAIIEMLKDHQVLVKRTDENGTIQIQHPGSGNYRVISK